MSKLAFCNFTIEVLSGLAPSTSMKCDAADLFSGQVHWLSQNLVGGKSVSQGLIEANGGSVSFIDVASTTGRQWILDFAYGQEDVFDVGLICPALTRRSTSPSRSAQSAYSVAGNVKSAQVAICITNSSISGLIIKLCRQAP